MPPSRVRSLVACTACAWGLAVALACGAPPAERATGKVARAVESSLAGGTERFEHREWDDLLARGTRDGLVDYRFMGERRADLDAYFGRVARASLSTLASGHLEALFINAYNAYTVRSILDHPGVDSIREIPGVWTKTTHAVGGFDLTLDDMEHRILRPYFRDPRVHFALNCASRSCAPLPPWAYDGDRLDEQLEERTRSFLSDPKNVRVEDGTLKLSKYFEWYAGDFTAQGWKGAARTIPEYVARYAAPDVKEFIESRKGKVPIEFLEYDWSLNAAVAPSRSQP